MGDFSFGNQTLLAEAREVCFHVLLVSAIYELFEILCAHCPKFAHISHRLNFGAAQHVGPAAMFVWLPRLNDAGFSFPCFWRFVRARLAVRAVASAQVLPLVESLRGRLISSRFQRLATKVGHFFG